VSSAAAPQIVVHQSTAQFLFGCAFYATFIAVGLLALLRTRGFNRVYDAWLQSLPPYLRHVPTTAGTRFVGVVFVLVGTFLLGFSIFDQFFR